MEQCYALGELFEKFDVKFVPKPKGLVVDHQSITSSNRFNFSLNDFNSNPKPYRLYFEVNFSCILFTRRKEKNYVKTFIYHKKSILVEETIAILKITRKAADCLDSIVLKLFLEGENYFNTNNNINTQIENQLFSERRKQGFNYPPLFPFISFLFYEKILAQTKINFDFSKKMTLDYKKDFHNLINQLPIEKLKDEDHLKSHYNKIIEQKETDFKSLIHSIGTPLGSIDTNFTLLEEIHQNLPSEIKYKLNKIVYDKYSAVDPEIDYLALLNDIKRNKDQIFNLLKRGSEGLDLTKYELEYIPVTRIMDILKRIPRSNDYTITVDNQKEIFTHNFSLLSNETLLEVIFSNIINNAKKHAFRKTNTKNKLKINFTFDKKSDEIRLSFENNGNPFPSSFTKEMFISKYQSTDFSSGQGLGGFDIHRIMKHFGGDLEVINQPLEEFPVAFILRFADFKTLINSK